MIKIAFADKSPHWFVHTPNCTAPNQPEVARKGTMTSPYGDQPDDGQEYALAILGHEERPSDSPYIEKIGRIRAESEYSSLCPADVHWNMLLTRHDGKTSLAVWGPMTKAAVMPYREGAEFLYIQFKLGTFIPYLPARNLLDAGTTLPNATRKSFWLYGSTWQFPEYENAETFVDRLVRESVLAHEPVVEAVMQDERQVLSMRSAQRRFLQATGLTQRYVHYVERARRAAAMLQQGVPILDTVFDLGYVDQPHLTRSLKHLIGQTPMQIARVGKLG
jgi:AraC-like DNA-binding protein